MIGWKRFGVAVMKFVLGLYNTAVRGGSLFGRGGERAKVEKNTRREK